MKKKTLLFLTILALSFNSQAQNLIPNPGFEVQDTCPAVSQIYLAQPWVSASLGSPDLFNNSCSSQNLTANTGIGSSGVYLYNQAPNNREYIEAPLTSSLSAGQDYCVSFYVKRSNYRYGCNQIGAYFSSSLISETTTSALPFTPQVNNNPATMLSATGWIEISGSFTASGGENHILIGSFSSDVDTDTLVVNSGSSSKVCFYQIDNVSVIACAGGVGVEENSLDARTTIFPNPASNLFSVNLPGDVNVTTVMIYNSVGQEIRNIGNPDNNNGTIVFSDLGMSSGVYMITILTDQGTVNRKLIIE